MSESLEPTDESARAQSSARPNADELTKCTEDALAEWETINKIERGKLAPSIRFGGHLAGIQKVLNDSEKFYAHVAKTFGGMSKRSAQDYLRLHKHQAKIANAKSIAEALKLLRTPRGPKPPSPKNKLPPPSKREPITTLAVWKKEFEWVLGNLTTIIEQKEALQFAAATLEARRPKVEPIKRK